MKISIIIPVYNLQDYVERCVRSCLDQTHCNLEIIAVDDGSTDSSLNILRRISTEDSRLRVETQSNGGVSRARMRGLALAKGEWIVFVDGDDRLFLDALTRLIAAATDTVDAVIGRMVCVPGNYPAASYHQLFRVWTAGEYISQHLLRGNTAIGLCSYMLRREHLQLVAEKINYSIKNNEDFYILVQVLVNARAISAIDTAVYEYVRREGSASKNQGPAVCLDMLKVSGNISFLLKRYPDKVSSDVLSSFMAQRCLLLFCGFPRYFNQKRFWVLYRHSKKSDIDKLRLVVLELGFRMPKLFQLVNSLRVLWLCRHK